MCDTVFASCVQEEVEPFPGERENFLQQLYKFMEDRGEGRQASADVSLRRGAYEYHSSTFTLVTSVVMCCNVYCDGLQFGKYRSIGMLL